MTQQIGAALAILDEAVARANKQLADSVREATLQGRTVEAKQTLELAEEIEGIGEQLDVVRQRWLPGPPTPPGVTDHRAGRGRPLSREAYCIPILRALAASGGRRQASDILRRVYEEVNPQLSPIDFECLPSQPTVQRWYNAANWKRLDMVNAGLLRRGSPTDVWEITDEGWRHLKG